MDTEPPAARQPEDSAEGWSRQRPKRQRLPTGETAVGIVGFEPAPPLGAKESAVDFEMADSRNDSARVTRKPESLVGARVALVVEKPRRRDRGDHDHDGYFRPSRRAERISANGMPVGGQPARSPVSPPGPG